MSPVFWGRLGLLHDQRLQKLECNNKVPYVAQENTPILGWRLSIVAQEMTAHTCSPCCAMCMACLPSQQLPR